MLQSLHHSLKFFNSVDNKYRSTAARLFNQSVKWAKSFTQIGYLFNLKRNSILPPYLQCANFLPKSLGNRQSSIKLCYKYKQNLLREFISETFAKKERHSNEINKLKLILSESNNNEFIKWTISSHEKLINNTLEFEKKRLKKKYEWNSNTQRIKLPTQNPLAYHCSKLKSSTDFAPIQSVSNLLTQIPNSINHLSNINTILNANNFEVVKQKPDGHCLLYSWSSCTNTNYDALKEKLTEFIQRNHTTYEAFGFKLNEFEDYIKDKQFNTDSVDILPNILSDMTNTTTHIIDVTSNLNISKYTFQSLIKSKEIILLRTNNNHFDSIIPREIKANTEQKFQETPECKNKETKPTAAQNAALVTDLTYSLDNEEINLLSKGPKYSLQQKFTDKTITDIKTNFCHLAYQIRWNNYIENKKEMNLDKEVNILPSYPKSDYTKVPPSTSAEIEENLKKAYSGILRICNFAKKHPPKPNITSHEKCIIRNLKSKPYTFLPSDKGTEFCVIKNQDYKTAGLKHLNDTSTYSKISNISIKSIEDKINARWKTFCSDLNIPRYIYRNYITHNSSLPTFYHLIKTHKKDTQIKIRPIVANYNGPTTKISWLLSHLLKSLLKEVPAHLERSYDLIEDLKSTKLDINKFSYPFSLDVVALYTSIPPNDAIRSLHNKLLHSNLNLGNIKPKHLVPLLEIILNSTYFTYENQIYKQTCGLPMGNSISGLLAIIFMDSLERISLKQCCNIGLYKRYVDDILILTTTKENALNIYNTFNSQHPNIKFEIEHPKTNSISLLDFSLAINMNRTEISFYTKSAKRNLFIHFNSAIPMTSKIHAIKNEITRITNRCTKPDDLEYHLKEFSNKLELNGYPKKVYNNLINNKEHISNKYNEKKKYFYMRCPYLGDTINSQFKSLFRKLNLPVRLYSRSYTLRNVLKLPSISPCNLKNCPLRNALCNVKNCVYEIKCQCNNTYIGSTIRPLHIRFTEHLKRKESPIYKHKYYGDCKYANFTIKIITKEDNPTVLRIKEAHTIRIRNPSLNNKEERNNIDFLLFD